ncbi:MAG TPA: helix-turn-helix domain-containing protein [Cyclobacteriaceae bacterium]|nr:helix-turn-helix domain-containing protein [Cyclobacteriaceae bacterium]
MKKRHLIIGLLAFGSVLVFASALSPTSQKDDFLEKRAELVIRKVGHLLLLQAGDSSSRILPVKQLSAGIFQLDFQSQFSFKPDSLVKIVRQNLIASNLPINYIVSVFTCHSKQMVYGFEINPSKNVIACMGRTQPKGCYSIQIAFTDFGLSEEPNTGMYRFGLAAMFVSLIAFVGYGYVWRKKPTPSNEKGNAVQLGNFLLLKEKRLLKIEDQVIELSDKESKLLEIFAAQQNQLIERDRLLKEVWEDDGVFTARSLDVFVSKLRKKLKSDPSIQIINVYGKGYRLEVSNQ